MTAKITASEWRGTVLVVSMCANVEGHLPVSCPWDFGPTGYPCGAVSRPETQAEQTARVTLEMTGLAEELLKVTPPALAVNPANPTGLDGQVLAVTP